MHETLGVGLASKCTAGYSLRLLSDSIWALLDANVIDASGMGLSSMNMASWLYFLGHISTEV